MEKLADLIGRSPEMETLRGQVRRLLQLPAGHRPPPVLLLGETGTGKGLVARLLHRDGPRAAGPFIDVNCAAIPETLLEAELFGFERGAFTDASQAKPGLFQAAHRGTLFLDEVGTLLDGLQAKLLTSIESREVRRLGSTRSEPVDVWILAATSEDLVAATHARRFRPELYHRLATVVLRLPPLRSRGRDVLELATCFLARAAADHGVVPKTLADDASAALLAYGWPGNVRELANVLERVTLLEDGAVITAPMLALPATAGRPTVEDPVRRSGVSLGDLRRQEREELIAALTQARGNITQAAARLGIPRNTLRYRMAKHGLSLREAAAGESAAETSPAAGAAPTVPPPSVAVPALRWEQRLITMLAVRVDALEGTAPFQLASVLETLMDKVTSFGARIEDLTPGGLVAAFGLDAMEDGPRRAVLAARAMTQALRPGEDPSLRGLSARCTVHLGRYLMAAGGAAPGLDARARHEAWTTVNALLEQTDPNGIVLDAAAARFVERRFALEPTGHGTTPAYRVMVGGERPGFHVGGRTLTRLVGRERDLDTLHELLRRTEAGEGQSVGLVGEPGVGKSRLVYEFRRRLEGGRITCLEGRCLSYGRTTPYLPIMDFVRDYFGTDDRDPQAAVAAKLRAGLQALGLEPKDAVAYLLHLLGFKEGTEPVQASSPHVVKTRTIETLKHLVLAGSRRRPLVIVVEDLHWIDPSSEEALGALVESLAGGPLMLLTTYRPGYQPAWLGRSYASQLVVQRLTRADSLAVVRSVRPNLAPDLAEVIVKRGEGVPFFLEELARMVADDDGHRVQVPDTIQGVLLARLDRLPAEDRDLLQTASVVGTDITLAVLAAVAQTSAEALAGGLARLQAAEFLFETSLVPEVQYTFKHALTHEVAYESLLQDRRRALHARAVAAIEGLYPERLGEHVERLAHHAFRGEAWEKAVLYLRQAGERATERSAYREAAAGFEQALDALRHLPETRERTERAIDLHHDASSALGAAGGWAISTDHASAARALAEALGDEHRLVRALHDLGNRAWSAGDPDRALELGQRALAIAHDDVPLQTQVSRLLGGVWLARGDYRHAIEHLDRLVEAFQGDRRYERSSSGTLLSVITRERLAWCLAELGEFADAMARAEDAGRIAREVDHTRSLIFAHRSLGLVSLRRGDVEQAIPPLERAVELCRVIPAPVLFDVAGGHLGYAYALSGRLPAGVALIEEALADPAATGTTYHPLILAYLGEAHLSAGRRDDALAVARRALDLAQRQKERGNEAWVLRLLGEITVQADPRDLESAEEHFGRALARAAELGMRPLAAHCHLGLGKLHRRAGNGLACTEHLAMAAAMYRDMGMGFWLARIEAEPAGMAGLRRDQSRMSGSP